MAYNCLIDKSRSMQTANCQIIRASALLDRQMALARRKAPPSSDKKACQNDQTKKQDESPADVGL